MCRGEAPLGGTYHLGRTVKIKFDFTFARTLFFIGEIPPPSACEHGAPCGENLPGRPCDRRQAVREDDAASPRVRRHARLSLSRAAGRPGESACGSCRLLSREPGAGDPRRDPARPAAPALRE